MFEIDFEKDIKLGIQDISSEMGVRIPMNQNINEILLDYLTVRTKIIEPKIRNVFVSPDLKNQIATHSKRKEIETIIACAVNGKNLNIFQSSKILQTNFHDHLQNEWNIYHFHLSVRIRTKNAFVKPGNSLLFAYIDENQIVFLGCDTHKEGIFADTKWIEILHDHFPEVIEKYKTSLKDVYPNVNANDRQMLWNKGYTIHMTKVRDVVYGSPGVGRSTTGHGTNVGMTANKIMRWMWKLQKQLEGMMKEVCEYLFISPDDAQFRIIFGERTLELYEMTSTTQLLEFPDMLIEKEEIIQRISERKNQIETV